MAAKEFGSDVKKVTGLVKGNTKDLPPPKQKIK